MKLEKFFDYCFVLFLKEINLWKHLLKVGNITSHLPLREIGWLVSLLLKLFHR